MNTLETKTLEQLPPAEMEEMEALYWSKLYDPKAEKAAGVMEFNNLVATSLANVDILAFNRVLGFKPDQIITAAQLTRLIRYYREQNVPRFFLAITPELAIRYHDLLEIHGFVKYNQWAKLYLDLNSIKIAPEREIQIEIPKKHQQEIFAEIIKQAFDFPARVGNLFKSAIGKHGYQHFLAFHHQKPISAASIFLKPPFASLSIGATLPSGRGMGAQKALIAHRLKIALEKGCRYVFVETAEDLPEKPSISYQNMIKMGFRLAYLRPNYIHYNQ